MRQSDRFKLRYGPYRTPRFRYGSVVKCRVRGDVIIVGITNGRIPWPMGRKPGRGSRGPVVYGDLLKALRQESGVAICHWWGVTGQTVSYWRKALGIGPHTKGSRALRSAYWKEPWARDAVKKAWAKARDPERCAKIAAAKRGKPRLPSVRKAMRQAALGRKVTPETRRKLSEAHLRWWRNHKAESSRS
jgi:hypothetical protein